MNHFGNLEVIKAFKAKKASNKIAVIFGPGNMRGAYQAGVAVALEELGLVKQIDTFIGISSGAAVGLYTLSGEAKKGAKLIHNEFVNLKFINFLRFWKILDVNMLRNLFTKIKPANLLNLQKNPTTFLTIATNAKSKLPEIIEIKNLAKPIEGILASLNFPIINGGEKIKIKGNNMIDGSLSNYIPNLDEFSDVLIVITSPLSKKIFKHPTWVNNHQALFPKQRILIIYPEKTNLHLFSMDKKKLSKAIKVARVYTKKLFNT